MGSQFHVPAQTTNFDNSSGTIAIGSGAFFGIPTWTNANSTLTMTNAATVYIQGPPVDSTNVTATNTAKALWVDAGLTALDGAVTMGSTITGAGVLSIDDTTESTSTTTGSIHTDGGLGVAGDIYAGDDIFLTSGAVLNFAAGAETLTHSANTMTFGGFSLVNMGGVILGVNETTNANMTIGLTVNQSTSDDEVFAAKSGDVAHGMTDFAEADTYIAIKKANAVTGGAQIAVYGEGNAGMELHVRQGAIVTTDTTSSTGSVTIKGQQWDGGTDVINAPATSNVLAVTDGANTRFIVKGNGAIHATNVTSGSGDLDGTALDGEDDIGLIRAFERTVHSDLGIIMSKWDEEVQAHADDLRRVGVFKGDFYCMQRMDSLLGGGIWQNHCRIQDLHEALDSTRKELAATQAQLRRISA